MTQEWRDLVVEHIVEPELEIIDAHHHLWPNPVGSIGLYSLPELHADTGSGHNVVGTVFVECGAAYDKGAPDHLQCVGETRFVAASAQSSADGAGAEILAIVPAADLRWPALDETLDAHEEAGAGRFRGVRHRLASDPAPELHTFGHHDDPGVMDDPSFRAGLRRLGERGLSFESWLFHRQLPKLIEVVRETPGTTVIVNHIGGPAFVGPYANREEQRPGWLSDMAELATCENTVLKVGGIGMTTYGGGWESRPTPPTSDQLAEFWGDDLRRCIDLWGPDRCMMESNFPVDRFSCSYHVLWNALKKISAGYSPTERAAMFAGTARRVYRLA